MVRIGRVVTDRTDVALSCNELYDLAAELRLAQKEGKHVLLSTPGLETE